MTTFRTTIVLDFDVENGTDPDVFHDELRTVLESLDVHDAIQNGFDTLDAVSIETVREIAVDELVD